MIAWIAGPPGFGWADALALFAHFLMLSLLAVGGAMTTAPEMQRYVVGERGWIDESLFSASIALAQSAPGPNVMFVAVIGFNIAGLAGVAATMAGMLLPSTFLALAAARWGERRRTSLVVRSFTQGLMPITLGLLSATGWVLLDPVWRTPMLPRAASLALALATVWLMLRTRTSPMALVALGAVLGASGLLG